MVPLVGGLGQPVLDAEPGPVGLDPLAELASAADQRLVGHFHRGLAGVIRVALGRDQAGVGQTADDGLGVGAGRDELAERRPPLGVLGPLAGLGQAEEDPATGLALGVFEGAQDLVGPALQRPWSPPMAL